MEKAISHGKGKNLPVGHSYSGRIERPMNTFGGGDEYDGKRADGGQTSVGTEKKNLGVSYSREAI